MTVRCAKDSRIDQALQWVTEHPRQQSLVQLSNREAFVKIWVVGSSLSEFSNESIGEDSGIRGLVVATSGNDFCSTSLMGGKVIGEVRRSGGAT